ncbi:hypothetical protein PENSPDRAFT_577890 [Peniophora sp. CONT]|nr:hypothetical protein PENSPDRAFT_577890 [Peniophora sp. CONT]
MLTPARRFTFPELQRIVAALRIPDPWYTRYRHRFTAIEAFCLLVYRFRSGHDLLDLTTRFNRSASAISECINSLVMWLERDWRHLLEFDPDGVMHPDNLRSYARAFRRAGCPLKRVWGMIDCTIRAICRPSLFQRLFYSGHKRYHALKFESIVIPNGLIAFLFGPEAGRRNDLHLLDISGIAELCYDYCFTMSPDGTRRYFQLYGDGAYGDSEVLLSPFVADGENLAPEEQWFNAEMSDMRVAVEHGYGIVVNNWPFLNCTSKHRLFLSPVASYYRVAVLLTNIQNCLYPNQVSQKFDLMPPTVEEYLHA